MLWNQPAGAVVSNTTITHLSLLSAALLALLTLSLPAHAVFVVPLAFAFLRRSLRASARVVALAAVRRRSERKLKRENRLVLARLQLINNLHEPPSNMVLNGTICRFEVLLLVRCVFSRCGYLALCWELCVFRWSLSKKGTRGATPSPGAGLCW